MGKISAFNFITVNGFLSDPGGDISWHKHGFEENEFASDALKSSNTLLFGRKTYEMMASYWPTPVAYENDPEVAEGMNRSSKIVFSNTLKKPGWKNTVLINGDIVLKVKELKKKSENDFTILGSGSILTLFAENDLIDEYQLMIDPVSIGTGVTIFHGLKKPINLKLTNVKTFKSGVILLSYIPNNQNFKTNKDEKRNISMPLV